jgi:hypothetical protein
MAEIAEYKLNHKELAALMVKHLYIHEGTWQLVVHFGFAGLNAGPKPEEINPAALVAISSIGLKRATEITNLTVDAAVVNPAQ